MKITKRQLRQIIREEYRKVITESVKDIATEMLNYLDHLLRELSMQGRMDTYAGSFDAADVHQFIQEDAKGAGIIYDYFPDPQHAEFVLSSDVDGISNILSDMESSGIIEYEGKGTTKIQGRYWKVYGLPDFSDHSPRAERF
ncbi:MAG: hypothetical protein CBC29_06495 [Methylococcaceae bacterium TMED69]|nr:MAG: hypothetical protein CBC29_06495 [Methylococcaceae bacterium TMED69]|tara:strand:- start:1616 stop:2041 length:426 start_codon:yes stop_codon:yes gene_type:complete